MDAFEEISYSDAGLDGRDLFLAECSDVLFYFEDEQHEAFYEKLLSLVAREYMTNSVFCLGGKDNLIKKAKTPNDNNRPRVFIVDRDFDHLLGDMKDRSALEGVVYLDRFSIENFLLEPVALVDLAIDRYSLRVLDAHRKCSSIEMHFEKMLPRYERLTRLFLISRKNRLSIPTTKTPYSELELSGEEELVSDDFVASYEKDLLSAAEISCDWLCDLEVLRHELDQAFNSDFSEGEKVTIEWRAEFCGKHLLGFIKNLIECELKVDLSAISSVSLYMDIIGRIPHFAQSFRGVKEKMDVTIARQRRNIHAVH